MTDQNRVERIATMVRDRLSHVIDPELGRSITDLGMIAGIDVHEVGENRYDVNIDVELTVPGCPVSEQISQQI